MDEQIRTSVGDDGVLTATIDMPGRRMNVFSVELIEALDALMDRVDSDPKIGSVVLTSAKSTFLAGADLSMVRGFTGSAKTMDDTQLRALCGRLGRQFVRLEAQAKPWVAAVNGLALGGGLELALACRARLVVDEPRTQIGVPEVRWGLLPGAGGTQRLPRLTGFVPAMKLLLGGLPIAPAEAVKLGMFARAVPAATLQDEAHALARSLAGQPYSAEQKYSQLAQTDVPAPGADTRRAVAAANGVSPEDLELYPAYGAIIDSVTEGARLPLDAAGEVEMTAFLTLMRGAVAGRMVGTLYLDRLRAERAIAVPETFGIERIGVGEISAARASWRDALAKAKKLPSAPDSALPADTLEIHDRQGTRHRVHLRVSSEPDAGDVTASPGAPVAVLSPAGPYGRVLEIAGGSEDAASALAALAAGLSAVPWRSPGPDSALQQLHGRSLEAQASAALLSQAKAGSGEAAFFDVAACISGVTPAWTGGPLTWLWAEQARVVPALDAPARRAFEKLEPELRKAFG